MGSARNTRVSTGRSSTGTRSGQPVGAAPPQEGPAVEQGAQVLFEVGEEPPAFPIEQLEELP